MIAWGDGMYILPFVPEEELDLLILILIGVYEKL